jgi:hypothetical protein
VEHLLRKTNPSSHICGGSIKKKKEKIAGTLVPRINVENVMKLGFVLA